MSDIQKNPQKNSTQKLGSEDSLIDGEKTAPANPSNMLIDFGPVAVQWR